MTTQSTRLRPIIQSTLLVGSFSLLTGLSGCGGGGGSAQVQAQPQSLTVSSVPTLLLNGAVTLTSSASSGLPTRYTSRTPAVCSVNTETGLVTARTLGTCTIAIDQPGNTQYAPATQSTVSITITVDPHQTIAFGTAPTLTLGGNATVTATATSGLAVTYSSATPAICTVDATSGLVNGLLAGTCTITANQSGNDQYFPATAVALNLPVEIPSGVTTPGAPAGVSVKTGATVAKVLVQATSTDGGGNAITSYTAISSPSGYTATSNTLPVQVTCTTTCAGESFTLRATNGAGDGDWSTSTHIIDTYDITEVFYEPDTQPRDSIFIGSFTFDATTRTTSNLQGRLSESMTGDPAKAYPNDTMTWLDLTYQLVSWRDAALGGTFVATFKNNNTNTFWTGVGGDGWSPASGVDAGGTYYGFPRPANNPGNAYALIFVPDNPTTPLTQAQLDKLAYADCAPGGMMGAVCMTGTSVAGYGAIGTMSGVPARQTITRRP